jgi:glycolate oxidase
MTVGSATIDTLAARLRRDLGDDAVVSDPTRLRTYECDGLAQHKVTPALVVLPRSTGQVADVVRACLEAGVPYVARGSGTGLSGGALPHAEGVLLVLSRMREVLDVDAVDQRAVVQPGVVNLAVSRAAAPAGYYYAPDPSSQQICSIGGNVAENSGGAHCLKYGFTTNHVLEAEVVLADGEIVRLDPWGSLDLLGAVVGSEGTLGIVTEALVRVLPKPERVETLLADYASTDAAGEAVSAIIAAGVIPAAIEMMDELSIHAAEHAPFAAPRTTSSGRGSGAAARRRSRRWAGSAATTTCRTASFPAPGCPKRCAGSASSPGSTACA